ncbi:MAG: hypothetical protein KDB88_00020 [Flavobacteriales bacterium]|nr:hypothetical protein [Flavobacteriales bacterium]
MLSGIVGAQPGTLDASFDPGTGLNIGSATVALQSDGMILIGGNFTSYNGVSRDRVARIDPDGTLDSTFDPGNGANGLVTCIVLQPDGKILIGGSFSSYNGIPRGSIARLNTDGGLDLTFDPGSGTSLTVFSIAIQPDGKIIIGGNFTSFNGSGTDFIARLNTDGSLDNSFDPSSGADNTVASISLQADGKILIAGFFSSYSGTPRNRIARLINDGSLDVSFDPGAGPDALLQTITQQPDGKILAGGPFSYYDGSGRNSIVRINVDGSMDASFDPGTGPTGNFIGIPSIAIQADGKILIGGGFTEYNGTPQNRIARLNADGSLDSAFDSGAGADGQVSSIAVQPDGKILIGGSFTSYDGVARRGIARINGALISGLDAGSDPLIMAIWPNPAQDLVHVGYIEKAHSIRLLNALGKQLQVSRISSTFSLTGCAPGTYVLQVLDAHGTVIARSPVVKQ